MGLVSSCGLATAVASEKNKIIRQAKLRIGDSFLRCSTLIIM
jgi:hypothetical protein